MQAEQQARAEKIFDYVLLQRLADTGAFATEEKDRSASAGCIKIKSLMASALVDPELQQLGAGELAAYLLDKARKLHAIAISRLRAALHAAPEQTCEPDFRPFLDAARRSDPAALAEIQRLMETAVYEQVDGQSEMQVLITGVIAQIVKLDPSVNVFADGTVEGSPELARRMQTAIDATGKSVEDLMAVPKVNGPARYVPISSVMAGLEGGRNGCRFDAIVEALS